MRRCLASAVCAGVMALAAPGPAAAQQPAQSLHLSVCLVRSQRLSISERAAVVVLAEANAIWTPHGLDVRWAEPSDDTCDRLIAVKADHEALPEDASTDSALGWVPLVAGRARQLVFLRVDRARTLIEAQGGVPRPDALTELLIAKLLGRSLAHELGHVLLNSQRHEPSGLMRARYRDRDVLSLPASAYTLTAVERARLVARTAGEQRQAAR